MEKITNSSDQDKENIPVSATARRSMAMPIRSRPRVPGLAPRKLLSLRYQAMKDKDDKRRKLLNGEDETSSDDSSIEIAPSLPNSTITKSNEADAPSTAYTVRPTQIPMCPTCGAKNFTKQTRSVTTQTADENMDEY